MTTLTNWPKNAEFFAYASTESGLYAITPVEALWHSLHERELQDILVGKRCRSFKLFTPDVVFDRSDTHRLTMQPVQVSRNLTDGAIQVRISDQQQIRLSPQTLHTLYWLTMKKTGPSGIATVRNTLSKLGLSISPFELNVRRLVAALISPDLIFDLGSQS